MLVDDSITLMDGTREVKFYNTPNAHSSGMLVGYVPTPVLFSRPTSSVTPFPKSHPGLGGHELIQKNKLSVEMIACAHGNAMPHAQFAHVLGK